MHPGGREVEGDNTKQSYSVCRLNVLLLQALRTKSALYFQTKELKNLPGRGLKRLSRCHLLEYAKPPKCQHADKWTPAAKVLS